MKTTKIVLTYAIIVASVHFLITFFPLDMGPAKSLIMALISFVIGFLGFNYFLKNSKQQSKTN